MCMGNTGGTGNVVCGTGYKNKASFATMAGTNVAACCDQKTCSDFTCSSVGKRAKSGATQPTAGNEPSEAGCCEAITGMCMGNTGGTGNVVCGTGYKNKASFATMAGTNVA